MVIVCEHCETRFQLDEARIPAGGARLRCSRCKHAFFLRPPGQGPEERADALAAEALEAEGTPPPEATRDLPERSAPASGAPLAAAEPAPGGSAGGEAGPEEDWQFNTEPAVADAEDPADRSELFDRPVDSFSSDPAAEPAGGAPAAAEAGEGANELEALGSPESWDLLGESGEAEAEPDSEDSEGWEPDGPIEEAGEGAFPEGGGACAEPKERAGPERAGSAAEGRSPQPAAAEAATSESRGGARALRAAAGALGWLAVAGLAALAALGMARPPAAQPVGGGALRAGGWRSADVRALRLENARAGSLLVVTGRFERVAGEAPSEPAGLLVAQLVDGEGRPLPGARAPLGRALPERRLRLQPAAPLRAALERSAARLGRAPPSGAVELQAVFASVPAEARGFVLAPGTAPEPARRTPAPSPPSPPPSSG